MGNRTGAIRNVLLLSGMIAVSGCGRELPKLQSGSEASSYDPSTIVIRSTAAFLVSTDGSVTPVVPGHMRASSGSTGVTVTNSASTNMTLDTSLFAIPVTITPFSMNDFGFLQLSALTDNDLKVCGSNGNTKCTVAGIRMYTTGTVGAGLWNEDGGYGAPITAGQSASALSVVGLDAAGASTMQSFTIANNRNTVKLSDFTNPKYYFKVDFTDAGAGSYTTTVVVEYFLALI